MKDLQILLATAATDTASISITSRYLHPGTILETVPGRNAQLKDERLELFGRGQHRVSQGRSFISEFSHIKTLVIVKHFPPSLFPSWTSADATDGNNEGAAKMRAVALAAQPMPWGPPSTQPDEEGAVVSSRRSTSIKMSWSPSGGCWSMRSTSGNGRSPSSADARRKVPTSSVSTSQRSTQYLMLKPAKRSQVDENSLLSGAVGSSVRKIHVLGLEECHWGLKRGAVVSGIVATRIDVRIIRIRIVCDEEEKELSAESSEETFWGVVANASRSASIQMRFGNGEHPRSTEKGEFLNQKAEYQQLEEA
ncbi:hypothetical protein FB45DRAFT_1015366 [Roridomyces roridus]|uniref:Uncharacterized protein n=1 Tax=Roridomyces roridus TaxID=1738132 RepID=A0AAD7AX07_9AGAR|nr:hypothetical protein FB45DRAFT_1015366 [Roridomyces roridus]